ncbi:MAG: hypothetical protein F6K18_03650 [Okeania sp. SIO2C2]|nr:hypothetical protein [Okeania sp. SIO2C2]NEP85983.1 hypothetical protein [Okeania sp. SIO2C2]
MRLETVTEKNKAVQRRQRGFPIRATASRQGGLYRADNNWREDCRL